MTYKINVATFNLGCGYNDYSNMLSNSPAQNKLLEETEKDIENDATLYSRQIRDYGLPNDSYIKGRKDGLMYNIEKTVAERLAKKCDVICLQEVGNMSRTFIKTLERKGFKIYCVNPADEYFSTAVALRTDAFEKPVNFSIRSQSNIYNKKKPYGQEIAGVTAKIKNSNLSMAFSSLHSPGFQLFSKTQQKKYSNDDLQNIEWCVKYTREAIDNIKKIKSDFDVIAGDFNNNPHNDEQQFKMLQEAGYERLESDAPTNINSRDAGYRDRKIDFIFTPAKQIYSLLARIWLVLTSFFISRTEFTVSKAKVLQDFDFTIEGNCSDHKPVVTTIKISTQSKIAQIRDFFSDR